MPANSFYPQKPRLSSSGEYESVPILFGANKHEGSFVYAVVYNSFLTNNNLTNNSDFLTYDLVPQLLRTVQVGWLFIIK